MASQNSSQTARRLHVASYECTGCGTIHHNAATSPASGLPVGWSANEGNAWCGSCTAAGIPQRQMRRASPARRRAS